MDAPITDLEAVARLRGDLAGFTVDAVTELLGPVAHAALAREQSVPAELVVRAAQERADGGQARLTTLAVRAAQERADGGQARLATLVAAFVLGLPVTRRQLAAALPALGPDGAQRLGLLAAAGAGADDPVRALVDLSPYAAVDALGTADWWVVSDLSELATGAPLRRDHVLGVGGASTTLARCTVRRPVGRVLDLGTGCGVQALHATRHAGQVVATDVSPRAIAFAAFTLALNGVADQVRLRQGDLLEPVRGELFDLVVSNPPFVITPRCPGVPAYEYRDGGQEGDDVVRHLVAGIGPLLAPGGVAQLLGNWEHRRGESWQQRIQAWLEDTGLDAWVVQRELQDPAEYAELWIRDGGQPERAEYRELYRAWLADFAARRVEAIGFGLVLLRRPADGGPATLRRLEELPGAAQLPVGDHLAACLQAHDWLRGLDDDGLLKARLRLAGDVTEERYHRPGLQDPEVILLRQGGGFGRVVPADTLLAGFVGACDGQLRVGQLAGALGDLLDLPTADVVAALLPVVRSLVSDGLLLPPGAEAGSRSGASARAATDADRDHQRGR